MSKYSNIFYNIYKMQFIIDFKNDVRSMVVDGYTCILYTPNNINGVQIQVSESILRIILLMTYNHYLIEPFIDKTVRNISYDFYICRGMTKYRINTDTPGGDNTVRKILIAIKELLLRSK